MFFPDTILPFRVPEVQKSSASFFWTDPLPDRKYPVVFLHKPEYSGHHIFCRLPTASHNSLPLFSELDFSSVPFPPGPLVLWKQPAYLPPKPETAEFQWKAKQQESSFASLLKGTVSKTFDNVIQRREYTNLGFAFLVWNWKSGKKKLLFRNEIPELHANWGPGSSRGLLLRILVWQ